MRIAGIDPERNFGGGEVQVMGLTLELLRAGHDAELLCHPDGELWRRANHAGIVCRPLKIRNSLDAAAGLRLRALLGRRHYDIAHFHTARAHSMAPYAFGRAGALVVTRRMDYVPNRLFAPWLYNHAVNGIGAISEGVARALMRARVSRERITIIPSGVDCTRFAPPGETARQQARAALGLLPHEIAVGTIGALVARKGHRILIDAMVLARQAGFKEFSNKEVHEIRCFIAGAGPLRHELAQQIAQRDLGSIVTMLGPLEDPATLLNALDIFVMPSLNEGMGVAALEAAAVGLPVIASAVGGLPEIVEDQRTGILVQPGDPAVLAEAIVRLGADRQWCTAIGKEARQRTVRNWSIELMAQRTLKLYYACLSKVNARVVLEPSSKSVDESS
ncbi:MAG: glycosyltransferase family 4 protein [Deltaproteobacteria bacterium]|nr:glycosyltransferase family 4 protein [Deltaproteobacteria bacterium]